MPEGLVLPGGKPADVKPTPEMAADASFAAAMAAPVQDVPAPPDREAREAKPRAQRKPRQPRGQKAAPPVTPAAEELKSDYTEDAQSLVGSVWTLTASIDLTAPYALPLASNSDAWVSGLAEGAKHNATIRKIVSGTGGNAWMLTLAAAGMATTMQAMAIMRDPKLRADARAATRAQLRAAMKAQGIDMPEENQEAPVGDVQPAGVPGA